MIRTLPYSVLASAGVLSMFIAALPAAGQLADNTSKTGNKFSWDWTHCDITVTLVSLRVLPDWDTPPRQWYGTEIGDEEWRIKTATLVAGGGDGYQGEL